MVRLGQNFLADTNLLEAIVRDASRVEDPELRELIARVRITHDK